MRQPGNKLNTIYISERVQERLRPARYAALTVLVAPMGYGKTTAVEWYLQSRERDAGGDLCARKRLFQQRTAVLGRALPRAGTGGLRGAGRIPLPGGRGGAGPVSGAGVPDAGGGAGVRALPRRFSPLRDRRAAELLCEFARCAPPMSM